MGVAEKALNDVEDAGNNGPENAMRAQARAMKYVRSAAMATLSFLSSGCKVKRRSAFEVMTLVRRRNEDQPVHKSSISREMVAKHRLLAVDCKH